MARIFITGSADGLGQLSAKSLIEHGHKVVLHARNAERGQAVLKKNPGAESVAIGDLSNIEEIKNLAHEVNKLETFDAVIHNAGVYQASAKEVFAVNTLAPYALTCLIQKPKRLVYLSSGMHLQGNGRMFTPLQLIPGGFLQRWVAMVRRTICKKDMRHRCGSLLAMRRRRK